MAVPASVGIETRGLATATRRVGSVFVFVLAPAAVLLAILAVSFARGPFLYDFRGGLYGAGTDILHGQDPYRPGLLARQAAVKRAGGEARTVVSVPVYPAPALVAAAPLALLPYRLAGALFVLLSAAALALALHLLEVRDWRCYGLAFASWPVLHGLMLGAVTPLLVLGVAAAWRLRSRAASGAVTAGLVVTKLFPWPLVGWLALTRRWRATVLAVSASLVLTLAAWAAIGFAGLAGYPRMLEDLSYLSQDVSVSLVAGLMAAGLGSTVATACAVVCAAALLAAAASVVRHPDGDRRAFGLAVVAMLVASPIVWPHYTALLLVPVALLAPRLSPLWAVPLLAYLAPVAQTDGKPWAIAPYLLMCAVVAWAQLARPRTT